LPPRKSNSLRKKVSYHHMMYTSFRSTCFLHSSAFYPTPKSYSLQYFSIGQAPLKVPLVKASTSSTSSCSLDPPDLAFQTASRSVQPFLAQLMAETPYTLPCVLIMRLCASKKLMMQLTRVKIIVSQP